MVIQAGRTRDPIEEVKAAEASGRFRYVAPTVGDGTDSKPQGEEKEKPAFVASTVPKPVPSAAAAVVPPPSFARPLEPTKVAPAPPKPTVSNDEFLDPELDLDIEGVNLDDADAGVSWEFSTYKN